jgi:hypothetical protein
MQQAGGGWLVSWKDGAAINSELPDPKRFSVVEIPHAAPGVLQNHAGRRMIRD